MSETCQNTDCDERSVTRVEIPSFSEGPGAKTLTFPYCREHADAILSDGRVFPGARELAPE